MRKITSVLALLVVALGFVVAMGGISSVSADEGDGSHSCSGENCQHHSDDSASDDPGSAIPADGKDLFEWLQAGNYSDWHADAESHMGNSPHGEVRVFFNDILYESVEAGNDVHPMGAASVKELYTDGVHTGWAAEIKVDEDSDGGNGWFWFKADSIDDDDQIKVAETGFAMCTGCHARGNDFVLAELME